MGTSLYRRYGPPSTLFFDIRGLIVIERGKKGGQVYCVITVKKHTIQSATWFNNPQSNHKQTKKTKLYLT